MLLSEVIMVFSQRLVMLVELAVTQFLVWFFVEFTVIFY